MAFSHEECNDLYSKAESDDEVRRSLSGRLLRSQKLEQCDKRLALRLNYLLAPARITGY